MIPFLRFQPNYLFAIAFYRWKCNCTGNWVPSSKIPRTILLPEHHRQGNVLTGEPLREEQARIVGFSAQQRWERTHEPEHQPMYRAHSTCSSGCLWLIPITAHLPWKALTDHQWLPQPNLCALCLRRPSASLGKVSDHTSCLLIECTAWHERTGHVCKSVHICDVAKHVRNIRWRHAAGSCSWMVFSSCC